MNSNQELLIKMKNATAIDFIEGYDVKEEYLNESLHVTNLYDGMSILSNYNTFEMIIKSVENNIKKCEEEIAICYGVYTKIEKLSKFLIKHNSDLESFVQNKKIDEFTLDKDNDNGISSMHFDYDRLYNNEGLSSLHNLQHGLWDYIESYFAEIEKLKIVLEKLKDAVSDEYIEDEDEIAEKLLENYSKLDFDRLEKLDKKTKFDDKEDILYMATVYYSRYSYLLKNVNNGFYETFIGRNFDGLLYSDYFFISNLCERLKDSFGKDK